MLIKTVAASLCHSDIMAIEDRLGATLPRTSSHEGAGIVVAVGFSVQGFKEGDRVMSGLIMGPCGQCLDCIGPDDWHQYCTHSEGTMATTFDGAFADYHITDSRTSCIVPNGVDFVDAAPLACAGRTVYRAIMTSDIKPGQYLAIVGAGGGLGHLGVQFAAAKGVNVIAIDARDEALQLCQKMGAKYVVDARKDQESVVADVLAVTGGRGADATVNVSPHPTSAHLACAVTKMHGTMVQTAGVDVVAVPISQPIFRDINIKGTLLAGRQCSLEMLAEFDKHHLQVGKKLFYGLEQVPEMVEALHSGHLKGKAVCVVDNIGLEHDRAR